MKRRGRRTALPLLFLILLGSCGPGPSLPAPTPALTSIVRVLRAYRVTTRSETYLIQVLPPTSSDAVGGFWGGGRSWLDARTVSVGSRDVSVDIVLEIGVRLSGIVRSAGGVPLEGATLDLSDGRGAVAATSTDEAGRFVLAAPPGTYTLDVFAPFPSSVQSVTGRSVDLGTTRTLDVVLSDAAP